MEKGFKRRALLTVVWLAFIFVLLQTAGFVLFSFIPERDVGSYGYPQGLFTWHRTLNYLYRPGFTGHFTGERYADISFTINDHGFRDDPFRTGPGAGKRIVVLGDSVVFGSGVRKKDRFTELLQETPQIRDAGVQILNLGVNSYSFGHYLELARLRFMDLEPDGVVVGFTLNDIQPMDRAWPNKHVKPPRGQNGSPAGRRWYQKPLWVRKFQQYLDRTYAGRFVSYTGDVIKGLFEGEGEGRDYHTKWMRSAVEYWSESPNRDRLRDELILFREQMREMAVPFVFVFFPERNDLVYPEEFSLPRHSIVRMLDELDMEYCDAYDNFANHDVSSLYLPDDSVHFTQAGHSVVRDTLLACEPARTILGFPAGDMPR